MEAKSNLLIVTDADECVYVYPKRRSLAEIAYIASDIPSDEILINMEIVFVDMSLPNALSIVEDLREYAREYGGIQRIIAFSRSSALTVEEMLKLAAAVEEAGAEFAPQFL